MAFRTAQSLTLGGVKQYTHPFLPKCQFWLCIPSTLAYGYRLARMMHRPAPFFIPPLPPVGLIFVVIMPLHSPFRRFVSLWLAVLVLTASVGLTVQRLTCRMSGRSTVQLAVPGQAALHGCGGQLAPTQPEAKDNCCDFSSHVHKLTAPAHELAAKVLLPGPLLAVWLPAPGWRVARPAAGLAMQAPRWFAADASPPPLGGRELLARVGALIV